VNGARQNIGIGDLTDDRVVSDIGDQTITAYVPVIQAAKTNFVNGQTEIYERELFEKGTQTLWNAVADSNGFSVVGSGDSAISFAKYVDMSKLN